MVETFGTEKIGRGADRRSWSTSTSTCARAPSARSSTCTARSTRRPRPTATSAATTTTSRGRRRTRPTRCGRPPASAPPARPSEPTENHESPAGGGRALCAPPQSERAHPTDPVAPRHPRGGPSSADPLPPGRGRGQMRRSRGCARRANQTRGGRSDRHGALGALGALRTLQVADLPLVVGRVHLLAHLEHGQIVVHERVEHDVLRLVRCGPVGLSARLRRSCRRGRSPPIPQRWRPSHPRDARAQAASSCARTGQPARWSLTTPAACMSA